MMEGLLFTAFGYLSGSVPFNPPALPDDASLYDGSLLPPKGDQGAVAKPARKEQDFSIE